MSSDIRIKVVWHNIGYFYTVRNKRLKDLKSLERMREKIFSTANVEWAWHVVLTFAPASLKYWFDTYGSAGKALGMFFTKIRQKFDGYKFFWKYEEGTKVFCKTCNKRVDYEFDPKRDGYVICDECGSSIKSGGDLPHFHVLFDFVNRTKVITKLYCKVCDKKVNLKKDWGSPIGVVCVDCGMRLIIPFGKYEVVKTDTAKYARIFKNWTEKPINLTMLKKLLFPHHFANVDWKQWIANQYRYKMNSKKTELDLLLGFYLKKKWDNGIVYARKLKGKRDLKEYVKKDFFKYTESRWLSKDPSKKPHKWDRSRNLIFDSSLIESEIGSEGAEGAGGDYEGGDDDSWGAVLEEYGLFEIQKALELVKSTKHDLIKYYDKRGLAGSYIYNRVWSDISEGFAFQKSLRDYNKKKGGVA